MRTCRMTKAFTALLLTALGMGILSACCVSGFGRLPQLLKLRIHLLSKRIKP